MRPLATLLVIAGCATAQPPPPTWLEPPGSTAMDASTRVASRLDAPGIVSQVHDADLLHGQRMFQITCTPCHGSSGRGDGVMGTHMPRS